MPKHMQMFFEPIQKNIQFVRSIANFQMKQDSVVQSRFMDIYEQQKQRLREYNESIQALTQRNQYLNDAYSFYHFIYNTIKERAK